VVSAARHEPHDPEEPGCSLDEQKKASAHHCVKRSDERPRVRAAPRGIGASQQNVYRADGSGGLGAFTGKSEECRGWPAGRRARAVGAPPEYRGCQAAATGVEGRANTASLSCGVNDPTAPAGGMLYHLDGHAPARNERSRRAAPQLQVPLIARPRFERASTSQ
jgi:hypothetical protein